MYDENIPKRTHVVEFHLPYCPAVQNISERDRVNNSKSNLEYISTDENKSP